MIVFAKAPRPGFVKTRLELDPTAAASLYTEFVRRTLQTVTHLHREAALELSVDMPCTNWTDFPIARSIQPEGDLGAKLYSALERGLSAGHPNVVILGSDSPTLPVEYVRRLLESTADVTLGPTPDGGYYGIACRRSDPAIYAERRPLVYQRCAIRHHLCCRALRSFP